MSELGGKRQRALMAIAVLLGFYVISLGLVAALVTASMVTIMSGEWIAILNITTVATTVAVLPAVFALDRRVRDAKREGCISVTREDQPALWRMVDDIAETTGSEAPSTLLLSADVNAGVMQSGSFLGLRPGRRTMMLGLPLVAVLSETQLRAVLAHEFGHYLGGDTKVGAVLYRASVGIGRARLRLRGSLTSEVFDSYADLFARVSFPVMRAQEEAADRLAAEITGEAELGSALLALPAAVALWEYHLRGYLAPAWQLGLTVRDPFTSLYLQWNGRKELRERAVAAELRKSPGEHDSHPALRDRLAALGTSSYETGPATGCLHLVADLEQVEADLRRNFTPSRARAFAREDVPFADLPKTLAASQGREHAESLLRPVQRMAATGSTCPPGSPGHLLDVLGAGQATSVCQRTVAEARPLPVDIALDRLRELVEATLGFVMVEQGLAEYALSLEGDAPFRLVQNHRTPLDLAALARDAVSGHEATERARRTLARRKIDLTWTLPSHESMSMSELVSQAFKS